MAVAQLFLAEAIVRTDAAGTLATLRWATGPFTTGPAETPANTPYLDRIKQPLNIVRELFTGLSTMGAARVGYGDIVLNNLDGALDAYIDYGWDGGVITVRQGDLGAAYPGGFTTVFVGTMEQPVFDPDTITIKVRDRIAEVQVPLQTTLYAGNNALPAGLEGVPTDLLGKRKPVCLGVVRNITPPCVNTSKLIHQVNDGAVASVDVVRDNGFQLGRAPVGWASIAHGLGAGVDFRCIAVNGSTLVMVGGASGGVAKVATSPDGDTWTNRGDPFAGAATFCLGLAYGAGLFVAVGGGGASAIATSTDGVAWTARTVPVGWVLPINDVVWVPSLTLFICCGGTAGTTLIGTSPDGITWTARTPVGTDVAWAVAFGSGYAVIVGETQTIQRSADGITWVAAQAFVYPTTGGNDLYDVTYGQGRFVACGTECEVFLVSDDGGDTWATRDSGIAAGVAASLLSVTAGAGFFVAGITGNYMVMSRTGDAWVRVDGSVITTFIVYGMELFGSVWVAAAASKIMRSVRPVAYANTTDLLNDTLAPDAGSYGVCVSAGYFRLGASPAGLITADVTQGAAAGDRKPGTMFSTLLTRAGKSASDWSAADVTAMDALGYILGYYAGPEDTPNVNHVLDFLAQSIGGWWGLDKSGIYRLKQLVAPSGTAVMAITENDIKGKPQRLNTSDPGRGLPVWRVTLKHTKNWTVQTDGVAFGVSDVDRALFALEWQTEKYDTAAVRTKHLLSPEITIETMLTSAANALTEATRIQTLRGTRRDPYEIVVELNSDTVALDLGSVLDFSYAPNSSTRYGLTGPRKALVLGVQPNAARREVVLTLWI